MPFAPSRAPLRRPRAASAISRARVSAVLAALAVAAMLGAARPAAAQGAATGAAALRPDASPSDVVLGFAQVLAKQDWHRAPAYMAPDALEELAHVFHGLAQQPMVATQLAQQFQLAPGESLATISGARLFEALLTVAARENPAAFGLQQQSSMKVLGVIREDSAHAHVVARTRVPIGGEEISIVEARSLVHTPAGWRLELPVEMKGMLAGMRQAQRAGGRRDSL